MRDSFEIPAIAPGAWPTASLPFTWTRSDPGHLAGEFSCPDLTFVNAPAGKQLDVDVRGRFEARR